MSDIHVSYQLNFEGLCHAHTCALRPMNFAAILKNRTLQVALSHDSLEKITLVGLIYFSSLYWQTRKQETFTAIIMQSNHSGMNFFIKTE